MILRTEVNPTPSQFKITHQTPVFSIGSCFADTMGQRLLQNKFKAMVNPFGVMFNPLSIFHLLQKNHIDPDYFLQNEEIWYHYALHSSFSNPSLEKLQYQIQQKIAETKEFLSEASVLIFTFGTAFIYTLHKGQKIVNNCHKQPAKLFEKSLLEVDTIVQEFSSLLAYITSFNPDFQIVMTVSPIRHIKDTIPLNSVSKSILRLACHKIETIHANVHYFPSYEMMMDDLRDYRFYKSDMLHPNFLAEEYIWTNFTQIFMDKTTKDFLKKWAKILKALAHKPFNPSSDAHQKFLKNILNQLCIIDQKMNVKEEIDIVQNQII